MRLFILLMIFVLPSFSTAALTSSKYYCMKIRGMTMGSETKGFMYAEVKPIDSGANVKVTMLEGWLKGKVFTGPYDMTAGTAKLNIFVDELFGTAEYISSTKDTRFSLDLTSTTLSTIVMSDYKGEFILDGTEGSCDLDYTANYCAQINNEQYDISFVEASDGSISGTLKKYPTGTASTLAPVLSSGGLQITSTTSTQTLNLEFSYKGVRGTYKYGSGPTIGLTGTRDPIGSVGCANVKVNGQPSEFYFSSPTIVGNYIYSGTGGGTNHPVRYTNAILKINSSTFGTLWSYNLGLSELRGSPVLDSASNIYAVVVNGRTRDLTKWDPQGDFSGASLHLIKINNPSSGTPISYWDKPIMTSMTKDLGGQGEISPAIGLNDWIYVGGDTMRAFDSDGNLKWTYTAPAVCASKPYYTLGSPLIYKDSTREIVIFNSTCGIHGVKASDGSSVWFVNAAATTAVDLSSPQWSRVGSTVYGIVTNFGDDVYCLNPTDGKNCMAGWAGSSSTTAKACDVTPSTFTMGPMRGGPLLDSTGKIFLGTKYHLDDGNDAMFTLSPDCASTTPTWELATGSDLYPAGVLTADAKWIVGNENRTTIYGTFNVFDLTSATPTFSKSYTLHGDPTWAALRLYSVGTSNYLLLSTQDGPGFLPGMMYSLTQSYGYGTASRNFTARGGNENTGR